MKFRSASKVLGVLIHDDEVIEIDDGLRPCFFYVEDGAVKVLSGFQYDTARANQYVEWSAPKDR